MVVVQVLALIERDAQHHGGQQEQHDDDAERGAHQRDHVLPHDGHLGPSGLIVAWGGRTGSRVTPGGDQHDFRITVAGVPSFLTMN